MLCIIKTHWAINKTVEEGLGLRSDALGMELVQYKNDDKCIHGTRILSGKPVVQLLT
jgi:hypothetical protein